jgi:cell filamentation protein
MPYHVGKDPYIDPTIGIFRNLLGISTQEELDNAEANITSVEIAALTGEDMPILLNEHFDTSLLKEIHQQLFGTIYDWAGKLRTVELSKGSTRFAPVDYLINSLDTCMQQLADENLLVNLDHDTCIERLAFYYGELIVIHPFREGNGRTIRTFLAQLADNANWYIAWDKMSPQDNIQASIAAYHGNEAPLQAMLKAMVFPR